MPRKKTNLDIKKDNPVPSIDKSIEWILSLNVPQVFTHELRQDIIENLEELQNGVEANNEQPKLDKNAFLAHSCSSIKGCCYGQSGDCDGTEKSFKEDLKRYEEWVGKMRNYFIKDDGDTTEGYCPPGCTCSL
jgi:hypothetical protein